MYTNVLEQELTIAPWRCISKVVFTTGSVGRFDFAILTISAPRSSFHDLVSAYQQTSDSQQGNKHESQHESKLTEVSLSEDQMRSIQNSIQGKARSSLNLFFLITPCKAMACTSPRSRIKGVSGWIP